MVVLVNKVSILLSLTLKGLLSPVNVGRKVALVLGEVGREGGGGEGRKERGEGDGGRETGGGRRGEKKEVEGVVRRRKGGW